MLGATHTPWWSWVHDAQLIGVYMSRNKKRSIPHGFVELRTNHKEPYLVPVANWLALVDFFSTRNIVTHDKSGKAETAIETK